MDDVKRTTREAVDDTKKAWRGRDGEGLGDKAANLGDDVRRKAANAGDDIRHAVRDAEDDLRHMKDRQPPVERDR